MGKITYPVSTPSVFQVDTNNEVPFYSQPLFYIVTIATLVAISLVVICIACCVTYRQRKRHRQYYEEDLLEYEISAEAEVPRRPSGVINVVTSPIPPDGADRYSRTPGSTRLKRSSSQPVNSVHEDVVYIEPLTEKQIFEMVRASVHREVRSKTLSRHARRNLICKKARKLIDEYLDTYNLAQEEDRLPDSAPDADSDNASSDYLNGSGTAAGSTDYQLLSPDYDNYQVMTSSVERETKKIIDKMVGKSFKGKGRRHNTLEGPSVIEDRPLPDVPRRRDCTLPIQQNRTASELEESFDGYYEKLKPGVTGALSNSPNKSPALPLTQSQIFQMIKSAVCKELQKSTHLTPAVRRQMITDKTKLLIEEYLRPNRISSKGRGRESSATDTEEDIEEEILEILPEMLGSKYRASGYLGSLRRLKTQNKAMRKAEQKTRRNGSSGSESEDEASKHSQQDSDTKNSSKHDKSASTQQQHYTNTEQLHKPGWKEWRFKERRFKEMMMKKQAEKEKDEKESSAYMDMQQFRKESLPRGEPPLSPDQVKPLPDPGEDSRPARPRRQLSSEAFQSALPTRVSKLDHSEYLIPKTNEKVLEIDGNITNTIPTIGLPEKSTHLRRQPAEEEDEENQYVQPDVNELRPPKIDAASSPATRSKFAYIPHGELTKRISRMQRQVNVDGNYLMEPYEDVSNIKASGSSEKLGKAVSKVTGNEKQGSCAKDYTNITVEPYEDVSLISDKGRSKMLYSNVNQNGKHLSQGERLQKTLNADFQPKDGPHSKTLFTDQTIIIHPPHHVTCMEDEGYIQVLPDDAHETGEDEVFLPSPTAPSSD